MELKNYLKEEELMQLRYRVIAEYPNSTFKVNDILNLEIFETNKWFSRARYGEAVHIKLIDKYPHLFKKLEWWEDRKPIEFPKYVKWKHGGIFEVVNWRSNPNTSQIFFYKLRTKIKKHENYRRYTTRNKQRMMK